MILYKYLFTQFADKDTQEREELRKERHRDRARDRNIARAAPDKRYLIVVYLVKLLLHKP